jgi:hypothetical protein
VPAPQARSSPIPSIRSDIELRTTAWCRRRDVDRDTPARESEAAVQYRRLHALSQIARRPAAETDDGEPWQPGAQIELDVRVGGRAAVDDEAVRTHEHGWI